jgi:hypothetical protein
MPPPDSRIPSAAGGAAHGAEVLKCEADLNDADYRLPPASKQSRIRLRLRRPSPVYRQLPDGIWQLEVRITDPVVIARLETASREQGRAEFAEMRSRLEGGE